MFLDFAAETAEIFLGIDAYPKSDIVNFLDSISDTPKSVWKAKSDAIYYSYHRAVRERNLPVWHPQNDYSKTVDFVTEETGLNRNDINTYLMALYTMANMGKLETRYWSPKIAGGLETYGTAQVAQKIKDFISPVTQTASAPVKGLIAALLIAGGLTAIGIAASKQAIKTKAGG